ncbi:calcium:proton antiporter [Sulfurovum lithotrophicum]|uniref:Calcium:proton antiporter n=1 Tax=Sulfurovum lithotrophicum TaxID=206403 RepID=A0A7U4RRJ3_9BACT|nr:calcium:proton antiporter [Sulfurovum lithotrophicum]AKF25841.1 calcium:proton antiporter [Sulfurovum lithotrophicum]
MQLLKQFSKEYSLFLAIVTFIGISHFEHTLVQSTAGNLIGLGILFVVIIYAAMSVAHHAEMLAEKFGEPYGTLILTMSAVIVEIVIIVIMMMHAHNPDLARDTIYSAIMLDINGLLGLAAIIGGLKYGEQPYNVDSSNSYLAMLLTAIGVAMVLPEFIDPVYHNRFMMFNVVVFIFLYIIFTRVQLMSHKYFFEYKGEGHCEEGKECEVHPEINAWYHSVNLVISIIVIGVLAEILSVFMGNTLDTFGLPMAIGAVGVAVISAAPELITAVRAAIDNRMQTVINIALGASLATVLLTIPAVIIVSKYLGLELNLSLTPVQTMMIALTLLVSMVNFNDGETNVLEGFLHFILFVVFVFLLFV